MIVYDIKSFKQTVRKYYKYTVSDYILPTMTSNTTPEGTVTANTGTSASYTSDAYKLWFNTAFEAYYYNTNAYNNQTIYNQYTFKSLMRGGTYTLSFKLFRQSNVRTTNRRFIIIDENDNEIEVWSLSDNLPNNDVEYSYNVSITVPNFKAIKYMADSKASSSSYICDYVYNLTISNPKIITGIEESTSSDYDYYKDVDEYKTFKVGNTCKLFYGGQHDVPPYSAGDIIIDKGNSGAFTFEYYLYPGTYKLTLAAGGQSSSSGYFYWPAGHTGNGLICNISVSAKSKFIANIGTGGTGTGHAAGQNTTLYVNDTEAIVLGGGGNNSVFTINTNVVDVTSIDLQDSSGGSNYGGSGANNSPLTPWADGGRTSSSSGHGGGIKIECLTLT